MFVNPVRRGRARCPTVFTKYGPQVEDPRDHGPGDRSPSNRDQWVKAWTSLVLK